MAWPSLFLVELFVYTQMLEIQNCFSYQKKKTQAKKKQPKKPPKRVCSAVDGMEEFLRPYFHKTVLRDFITGIWESSTRKTVAPSSSFLVHVGLIRKLKLK